MYKNNFNQKQSDSDKKEFSGNVPNQAFKNAFKTETNTDPYGFSMSTPDDFQSGNQASFPGYIANNTPTSNQHPILNSGVSNSPHNQRPLSRNIQHSHSAPSGDLVQNISFKPPLLPRSPFFGNNIPYLEANINNNFPNTIL